jgi:hypothetical protein
MSLKGNTNEEKIWNYLMDKFNNAYGVAGLMGNLYAESGFRSNNLQNSYEKSLGLSDDEYTSKVDNGTYTNFVKDKAGYGLAQWTYWSRKENLLNYAKGKKKSIGDLEMQLDFLYQELQGYKNCFSTIKNAKSILEASNVILLEFERPADQSVTVQQKRASFGQDTYDKFAKKNSNTGGTTQMGYTNSSLVNYTKISPNKTVGRNHAIDTITIHCVVGQCSVETLGEVFAPTSRQASSNYGVGKDGRIGMYVEEKDRSWCSSNAANDHRAITIEVASDTTHPYAVTDAALQATIKLCADICKRNGIKKLLWKGDKSLIGQVDKQNMTVHRWFANKSCPGDYLYERHGYIADEVNKLLGVVTPITPEQPVTPPAQPVSWYRVRKTWADAKSQLGAYKELANAKACVDKNPGYFVFDENGKSIYPVASTPAPQPMDFVEGQTIKLKDGATYYNGKSIPGWVFNSTLYYRGQNSNGVIFSTLKTGAITGVVKKENIVGAEATAAPTVGFKAYLVKVTADVLNIRKGPGVNYVAVGAIRDQGVYTIVEEQNGWGRLKSGAGWISLAYTKKI